MCPPFASPQNFLDPTLTNDGKPYGPRRYRELVTECYYIAKNSNTPYQEIIKITPTERAHLIELIKDEQERNREALEAAMSKNSKK